MDEDEFFRQLAGGMLAQDQPGGVRPPRDMRESGRRPGGSPAKSGSHGAPHRFGPFRGSWRQAARPRRARAGAIVVLAVGGLAMAGLILGSGGNQSATKRRPATASPHGQPNGRPATSDARLSASWTGRQERVLVKAWRPGGRAVIRGRLTTSDARPIADASISVLAADPSAPRQGSDTVGQVRTDRQGRFATAVALDRGAPHKLLIFTYLAAGDDTVPAAIARARLDVVGAVNARTQIRRTRRRTSIALEGTSPGEATVKVLVRQPGTRVWRMSSVVHATRRGRWEAGVYVPSYAPRGTYRVRARVLGDRRRGFLSAESQPITIRVW